MKPVFLFSLFLSLTINAHAQIITTIAGTGVTGYSGDGGPATAAVLGHPFGVAVDANGNVYVADGSNNAVRKIDHATGIITTIAGTGTQGYSGDGGPATSALLNNPQGVCVDNAGNIYIADANNSTIRKIDAISGNISTIAGTGVHGYSGDGGPATSAVLYQPIRPCVDPAGNIYIPDGANNTVRKIDAATGNISTIAGTGVEGYSGDGGPATSAMLYQPCSTCIDAAGNLYIADAGSSTIRKVDAVTHIITTIAGIAGQVGYSGDNIAAANALLGRPYAVCVDPWGNLYIADCLNERIRKVTAATGIITTVAGTGHIGFIGDGGPAVNATVYYPEGIAMRYSGTTLDLYIGDLGNLVVRKISNANLGINTIPTNDNITAYPNPATNTVTLSNKYNWPQHTTVTATDVLGRAIYTTQPTSDNTELKINTTTWASGTYFFSVSSNNEKIYKAKVVVKK